MQCYFRSCSTDIDAANAMKDGKKKKLFSDCYQMTVFFLHFRLLFIEPFKTQHDAVCSFFFAPFFFFFSKKKSLHCTAASHNKNSYFSAAIKRWKCEIKQMHTHIIGLSALKTITFSHSVVFFFHTIPFRNRQSYL